MVKTKQNKKVKTWEGAVLQVPQHKNLSDYETTECEELGIILFTQAITQENASHRGLLIDRVVWNTNAKSVPRYSGIYFISWGNMYGCTTSKAAGCQPFPKWCLGWSLLKTIWSVHIYIC